MPHILYIYRQFFPRSLHIITKIFSKAKKITAMTRVLSLQKSLSYVPLLDSSKRTESKKNESKKRSEAKKKGEPKTSELDMNLKNTKKMVKIHPLLSVLGAKNRDKAAAKPAFLRYLEYIKEAGTWDESSDRPVMHFH